MSGSGGGSGGGIWRVSWQDYRGWRTQDLEQPRPKVVWRDFTDRAEAERELRVQRAAGLTACLAPYVLPSPRVRRAVRKQMQRVLL